MQISWAGEPFLNWVHKLDFGPRLRLRRYHVRVDGSTQTMRFHYWLVYTSNGAPAKELTLEATEGELEDDPYKPFFDLQREANRLRRLSERPQRGRLQMRGPALAALRTQGLRPPRMR